MALLALDARLAAIVREAREPALGQLRLAWWRDALGRSPQAWPEGEPLLGALATWGDSHRALAALIDAWEAVLMKAEGCIQNLCEARADAFVALAAVLASRDLISAVRAAALAWSAVDCAEKMADPALRVEAHAQMTRTAWPQVRLRRAMRPLAVLHGLARRGGRRAAPALLGTPFDLLVAARLGLFGR